MRRVAVLAVCAIVCAAPAWAQSKAAIEKLNDKFAAAFNRGDGAAIGAMYAEDAYLMPPGENIIKGRAAIAAYWTEAAEKFTDAKITTLDVIPLGVSAAREIGTATIKTKAQPPETVSIKYVVVWRKIGGQWLLAADIWNPLK